MTDLHKWSQHFAALALCVSMSACGAGAGSPAAGSPNLVDRTPGVGNSNGTTWNYAAYDYFLPGSTGTANGRATVGQDMRIAAGTSVYDISGSPSITAPVITGKRLLSYNASEAIMVCPQAAGTAAEAFLLATSFNGGVRANADGAVVRVTDFRELANIHFHASAKCQAYADWQMAVDADGNVLNVRDNSKTGKTLFDGQYAVYKSTILNTSGTLVGTNDYYIVDRSGPELVVWTKIMPATPAGTSMAAVSVNPDIKQSPDDAKPRYQLLASVQTPAGGACGPVTISDLFSVASPRAAWTPQTCPKLLSFEVWDNVQKKAGFAATARTGLVYDIRNTYCTFNGANMMYVQAFDSTHPRASASDNGMRFGSLAVGANWLSSVDGLAEPEYKWSLQMEEYVSGPLPYGRQPADLTATCQVAVSEAGVPFTLSATVTLKNIVTTGAFTRSTLTHGTQNQGLIWVPAQDPPLPAPPVCGAQDCGRFGL